MQITRWGEKISLPAFSFLLSPLPPLPVRLYAVKVRMRGPGGRSSGWIMGVGVGDVAPAAPESGLGVGWGGVGWRRVGAEVGGC